MRPSPPLTLATLAAALAFGNAVPAAPPKPIAVATPTRKEPVSYAKEVADVISAKCAGCHSDVLAEGKLKLDDVAAMLKGGKRGPALVAGRADASLLFNMAAHRIEPVMPPAGKKDAPPLTPEELGLLKLWIDAGAKDDSAEAAEAAGPIELGTLPPGIHPVGAVDLTDDGRRVACGRANVVQVYDADSGVEIVSLGGHKDIVQSVRYSPDGRLLAAGGYQVVTLWNAPVGGPGATFTGHGDQVKALAVTPDGKRVVSGGLDKSVRVWDEAGKLSKTFNLPAPVLALAVAPDGKSAAAGCADGVVRLIGLDDGKERLALKGHTGAVNDLAFFAEGRRLATASADKTVRVWTLPEKPDAKPADPVVLTGSDGPLAAVAVRPDGSAVLAAGDDGVVRVWSPGEPKPARSFPKVDTPILALAVTPDGKIVAAAAKDGTARLFAFADGKPLRSLTGLNGPAQSVAFRPDGAQVVAAGADGGLKVWETATGQGVIAFGHTAPDNKPSQPVQRVAFPAAGRLVTASADKTLRSWTFEGTWSERRPLGPHAFRVLALDFNPDGTLLAAGGGEPSRSGEIKVWEVGKGMLVRTLDGVHSDTVFGLRFSPDGTRLASAGADKFVKVTRVADGKELRAYEGHTHHVMAVDWKADGKQLVSAGADNVLKVWDAESGEQVRTSQPAGKQITAVKWVPGKSELFGAAGDKVVRVWSADSGGVMRTLSGPSDYVFAVATSKDGARAAGGGSDGALFLWNGRNGQVARKIEPAAGR